MNVFFFFQAEDGIRDVAVTGVQTCALPISRDPAALAADEEPRVQAEVQRAAVRQLLGGGPYAESLQDRKSTRLNSSHGYISYAVFCLKKKKKKTNLMRLSWRVVRRAR